MDIVEAILADKKKYIILISGYLWWPNIDLIAKTLANNLNFELIYTYSLLPSNKLISSADHINFPALNEIVKNKLDKNKELGLVKGYIIVSYTFPLERLDFYPDFHININVNPILQTNIIKDLITQSKAGFTRLDIDNHISYLAKSWKTNKINKTIIYPPDYLNKQNELYGQIFDAIMDNIMKKVYGEKYDEYKTINVNTTKYPLSGVIKPKTSSYPLPRENEKLIKVDDETKMSVSDIQAVNRGIINSEIISDLDDIVISSDNDDNDDNNNTKSYDNDDEDILNNSIESDQTVNNLEQEIKNINISKMDESNVTDEKSMNKLIKELDTGSSPFYIGKRIINRIINV